MCALSGGSSGVTWGYAWYPGGRLVRNSHRGSQVGKPNLGNLERGWGGGSWGAHWGVGIRLLFKTRSGVLPPPEGGGYQKKPKWPRYPPGGLDLKKKPGHLTRALTFGLLL